MKTVSNLKKTTINPKFLIREKGNNQKAHHWNGDKKDTFCKMWKSGGMNKHRRYLLTENANGKQICTMCANNMKKYIRKLAKL